MASRKKSSSSSETEWSVTRGSKPPSESAVKDALSLIQADYWNDIRLHAKDIIRQIKEGEITSRDGLYEALHYEADSTQWVIYTYQARILLICTDTPDAYEEEFGEKPSTVEAQAAAAFLHDLTEQVEAEADGDVEELIRKARGGESDDEDDDE